jgi:glycosyltransferase involved in cell wall biosynthesis
LNPTSHRFTVFTPTFNRRDKLKRAYSSLLRQTFKDYEWLIVDDGSEDKSVDDVLRWKKEAPFRIRYYYQSNSGKYRAHNRAVALAHGELFLTLDSDDECVPEALEIFDYYWKTIPQDMIQCFAGVGCLCMDEQRNVIGDPYPTRMFDTTYQEARYKYHIWGEKWYVALTRVMRKYPFPVFDGIKFVPEGVVWSPMANQYRIRGVNECLHIYHIDKSKKSDQLTRQRGISKYAFGQMFGFEVVLNNDIKWLFYSPLFFIRSAILYVRFSIHANIGFLTQLSKLKNKSAIFLWVILFPVGVCAWVLDKIRHVHD